MYVTGIDPQVAFDKISCFDTADELAEYFQSEGIKGSKERHDACPIAQWMTQTTGKEASVAGYVIMGFRNLGVGHRDEADFISKVTPPMIDFMDKFDRGGYPELVG